MSKVSKIISSTVAKSYSQKINKTVGKTLIKTDASNLFSLSKSLLCLGMLGAVMVQSCEPTNFVEDSIIIDDSIFLGSRLDKALNSLGILIEPNNSINDIKTFSFISDKNEQHFFEIDDIKDSAITLKQIKFDSNLKREDFILTILPSGSDFEVIKTTDSGITNMKFVQEDNLLKSFILKNNEWVEDSIFQRSDYYIKRDFKDGSSVKYFDVKNNIEFPENIYFEQTEEQDDVVVFG